MKKNVILGLSALILLSTGLWCFKISFFSTAQANSLKTLRPFAKLGKGPQRHPSPLKMKDLQAQAISKNILDTSTVLSGDTEECKSARETLVTLSNKDMMSKVDSGIPLMTSDCKNHESQDPVTHDFYKFCVPVQDKKKCKTAAHFYRIKWIDWLTSEQTDYMKMDLALLMNKIIARGLVVTRDKDKSLNDTSEFTKMTDVLLAREPDFIDAYKLAFVAQLMNKNTKEALLRLAEAVQLDPTDREAVDALYSTFLELEVPEDIFYDVSKSDPDRVRGLYYEALRFDKVKDKNSALETLEKAAELDPHNELVLAAITAISKDESIPNSFEFELDW